MFHQCIAHSGLVPFYLNWQLKPKGSNYNLCFSYSFKEHAQVIILIEKLQQLVKLKAHLRQTFKYEQETLFACIHDNLPPLITFLTTLTNNFPEIEDKLIREPHDITMESSIKVTIINFKDSEKWMVLFNIHHIIMDGISLDFFITDLNGLIENKLIPEESTDLYLSALISEKILNDSEKSHEKINNYIQEINLCFRETNLLTEGDKKDNFHYIEVLPEEIFQNLKNLSLRYSISIFNLLLLAQGIFISKIFNQNHSLIHYPVNCRKDKRARGCIIGQIILPIKLETPDSYSSLIHIFKKKIYFLKAISNIKLENLPPIDSIPSFAVSAIAKPLDLQIAGQSLEAKTYQQIASSILSLKYQQREDKLFFTCDITAELFPKYLTDTLLLRFFNYLDRLVRAPMALIAKTDLTFEKEKDKLLYTFNNPVHFCLKNKTIPQLFEEEVDKNPLNTALLYQGDQITYSMINSQANQLAHYLLKHYDINPKIHVALFLDNSPLLILAMLAILKTGSAYTCFDSNSNNERITTILKDAKAKIILINAYQEKKIATLTASLQPMHVVILDKDEINNQLTQQSIFNPKSNISCNNLAHLIYTSGTTGAPKGVMIEHKNVISLVKNVNFIRINSFDTFALLSDISFDASTFEIWGALLNGARLYIPENKLNLLSNIEEFKQTLKEKNLTILWLTKTLFDQLFYLDPTLFGHLQYLIIGGEPLNKALISKLALSAHKPTHLINGYGPTENTTFSTTYEISHHKLIPSLTVPIGVPLSNKVAYLLDLHLNLLPIGAIGELYVGGTGLARGYWNNNKLTSQKFIFNPFQTQEEKKRNENYRLYKTGDLVRILPDGNFECLGRNDFQIKIRGYRIESAEIERNLTTHPLIHQALILGKKHVNSNEKEESYLIAYYVSKTPLDEIELRNYLAKRLPEYMLPNVFIFLKEFPKTSTGKLDRKALPPENILNKNSYIEPRNEQEKLICAAFSEVLNLKKISITDDFFYLGGTSIKAIALASILQLNFKIIVSDIFKKRTPCEIGKNITFSKNNLINQIEKIKLIFSKKTKDFNYHKAYKKLKYCFLPTIKSKDLFIKKPIANILLTGSTGYLGCNLLHQLLYTTDYNLFLLIRASSEEEAYQRLKEKFKFYFDEKLDDYYGTRLFIFASDLEKNHFDLAESDYQKLIHSIDSIIHSAALTKHYGDYDKFYTANVQATINLLELSRLTPLKDFHHISTISILGNNADSQDYLTEGMVAKIDDHAINYIKTKHEAENQVLKYKSKGVKTNIYRIGNLAFISENLRAQENIEDNAFLNRIKCFLSLNIVAEEIGVEEISPVDLTAEAILKIFDKEMLTNEIYHVFNPNLCNVAEFFSQMSASLLPTMKRVSIESFLNLMKKLLEKPNYQNNLIMRFMLHQGWLEEEPKFRRVHPILQQRTSNILKQLDFEWPIITKDDFERFIKNNFFTNYNERT